jgi:hypothetical protein
MRRREIRVLARGSRSILESDLSQRRGPFDIVTIYAEDPHWLDANCFRGTCYRAANWIHVGQTTGRGPVDREHKGDGQAIKDIYVYPLVRMPGNGKCCNWGSGRVE